MSRIKLLLDVVQDMRSLADSLQAAADAMVQADEAEAPAENVEKTPRKGVSCEESCEEWGPVHRK